MTRWIWIYSEIDDSAQFWLFFTCASILSCQTCYQEDWIQNSSGQGDTSDSNNQNNNKNIRDGSAENNETKSDSSD